MGERTEHNKRKHTIENKKNGNLSLQVTIVKSNAQKLHFKTLTMAIFYLHNYKKKIFDMNLSVRYFNIFAEGWKREIFHYLISINNGKKL